MTKIPQDESSSDNASTTDKAGVTLPGKVEKIIPSANPAEPEKAQINVEGAPQPSPLPAVCAPRRVRTHTQRLRTPDNLEIVREILPFC